MCVAAIIYKPVTRRYLDLMQENNPHGAGVAWLRETGGVKSIAWIKGLDAEEIHQLQESGALTYPYLLHFRWATHGPKVPELAHPFPLGPDAFFHDMEGEARSVLIHNGVWYGYSKHIPPWLNEEVHPFLSDTQVAAYVASFNEDILDEVNWATAVMRLGADNSLELKSRGRWFQHSENWYSNLTWLPWKEQPGYKEYVPSRDFLKSNQTKYTHGNQAKPQSKEPPQYYTSPYQDYDGDYEADSFYWGNDPKDKEAREDSHNSCRGGYYPGCEANEDKDKPLFTTEELKRAIITPRIRESLIPVAETDTQTIFRFNGRPVNFLEYQQLKYGTGDLTEMDEQDLTDLNGDTPVHNLTDEELVDMILEEREANGLADLVSEDHNEVNRAVAHMIAKDAMKKAAW